MYADLLKPIFWPFLLRVGRKGLPVFGGKLRSDAATANRKRATWRKTTEKLKANINELKGKRNWSATLYACYVN